MEEDDDEVLAWKALEEHEHTGGDNSHHSHSAISTGTDDDVEDFAELAYEHHARLEAAAAAATEGGDAGLAPPTHSLLHQHDHHQQQQQQQHGRFKRKNFSKRLQLLCLQRYAQSAKEHGKLPDKTECQLLLHQSYLQFLKDGGAPTEPRLSHQEFLKLIRNRRREMYARAQKLKFERAVSYTKPPARRAGATGGGDGAGDAQPLSAAKRKLQEEHAKIYELVEIIDQAREQSGLVSDHHSSQHQSVRLGTQRSGKRRLSAKSASPSLPQQQTIAHEQQQQQQLAAAPDPQEQIHAIFRVQQETLEIQREIAERLKVIRLHRSLRQHDPMEPSSASV